ncbi:MAG: hypothetical protein AAF410_02340 [Pseudomonadota bacterium]
MKNNDDKKIIQKAYTSLILVITLTVLALLWVNYYVQDGIIKTIFDNFSLIIFVLAFGLIIAFVRNKRDKKLQELLNKSDNHNSNYNSD